MTRANTLSALPLLALLALSGCVSFGGKPPKTLLTLTSDASLTAGPARTVGQGNTLVVLTPSASAMLMNDRIAVRSNGNDLAYLKDAHWADTPAKLFADLLAETIAAKTSRLVIDRRQYALAPGARLAGTLTEFALDATSGKAIVRYDAALAPGEGKPLQLRRFEASVPSAGEDPEIVARALNQAANQVAAQVAEWLGS